MRWIIGAGLMACLLAPTPSDACSCEAPPIIVPAHPNGFIGPDATLYMFVPSLYTSDDPAWPPISVTQARGPVTFDDERVFTNAAYTVRRIRLHGALPGPLRVVLPDTFESFELRVGPVAMKLPTPRIRGASYTGTGTYCGERTAFDLELEGAGVAAYRVRWWDEANVVHDAYIPTSPSTDEWGIVRGANHYVSIGAGGCSTKWLDPRELHQRRVTAEMSMLGFGGEDLVIARGKLELGSGDGIVPELLPIVPLAAPLPVAPADERRPTWVVAALGAGAGAAFVGLLYVVLRRRRPR